MLNLNYWSQRKSLKCKMSRTWKCLLQIVLIKSLSNKTSSVEFLLTQRNEIRKTTEAFRQHFCVPFIKLFFYLRWRRQPKSPAGSVNFSRIHLRPSHVPKADSSRPQSLALKKISRNLKWTSTTENICTRTTTTTTLTSIF